MPQIVLGLDIGSSHIKAVSVDRSTTPNKLLRYAMVPSGDLGEKLLSGTDHDVDSASDTIRNFLHESGFPPTEQVVAVLPENRVFSKIISMPMLQGKEFDEAIKWEAEQHIPSPLSDVYLKYTLLKEDENKKSKAQDILDAVRGKSAENETEEFGTMDVLLVAAPKNMVDRYMKIFEKAGLKTLGLEPISISIIRSTLTIDSPLPTIIVNLGQTAIDFYFSLENNLRFVNTTNFGISSIVKTISKELDVNSIQAGEYLFTYGFKENVLGGKIKEIILPVFSLIIDELNKTQKYVESRAQYFSDNSYGGIKRIVLTGGGALIPDLMLYLVGEVKPEVQYANPWKSVDISGISQQGQVQLQELGPLFAAAVGAAIK
mgnify:CR=1 FL=1